MGKRDPERGPAPPRFRPPFCRQCFKSFTSAASASSWCLLYRQSAARHAGNAEREREAAGAAYGEPTRHCLHRQTTLLPLLLARKFTPVDCRIAASTPQQASWRQVLSLGKYASATTTKTVLHGKAKRGCTANLAALSNSVLQEMLFSAAQQTSQWFCLTLEHARCKGHRKMHTLRASADWRCFLKPPLFQVQEHCSLCCTTLHLLCQSHLGGFAAFLLTENH